MANKKQTTKKAPKQTTLTVRTVKEKAKKAE